MRQEGQAADDVIENRLGSANIAGQQVTLRYDPLGRLHTVTGASGTRRFLYDPGSGSGAGGDELIGEYSSAGALLRRYVHGLAVDDPVVWYEGSGTGSAALRHLIADRQGSVIGIADSNGAIIAKNTYDEYGIPKSDQAGQKVVGRFAYTGQIWLPELGMYHYKARLYSPTLGRFMQTDPIGYKDQINLYAYVSNDPLNRLDPTGERDIYIGGAGDTRTGIVKDYSARQARENPGRDIRYFRYRDWKAALGAMSEPLKKGEPLNVVGHSLGARNAISIAAVRSEIAITNLITIDPVGEAAGDTGALGNTTNWTNVTADPASYGFSDAVADLGRAALGETDTSGADSSHTSNASHGDFSKMMEEAQALEKIEESYPNWKKPN